MRISKFFIEKSYIIFIYFKFKMKKSALYFDQLQERIESTYNNFIIVLNEMKIND